MDTEPRKPIQFLSGTMSQEAIQSVNQVLTSEDPFIERGPLAPRFEKEFAKLVRAQYAIATTSCTAALHIALLTAGVGPGDEILCTPFTYISSNLAVLYTGAKPVFVDVLPETLNMDPRDVEAKITYRTKAIMPVHVAGMPCDMDELARIAKANNLVIIEDAAQALGSTYRNKLIGSLSDFTCFSFNYYKPLPTATGGGMVTTNNADFMLKLRRLSYFGFPSYHGGDYYKKFSVNEVGMKYYMTEITAAMALANMKYFEEKLTFRRHIAERYLRELHDVPGLHLTQYQLDRSSSYYMFIAFVKRRPTFIETMHARGVLVGVPAVRNDLAPVFGGKRLDLPVLNDLEHELVGLPCHNRMTEEDITYVIASIRKGW